MNIAAIVQARTGSTRFPNKVFADLCGKPLIWHVFNRISKSRYVNKFILATTISEKDDSLQQWANNNQITCYRGSEDDVLDRYYNAALINNADVIVRITADDPLKDPEIMDTVIAALINENLDFCCNNFPPSFPEGLDIEVFSFKALETAHARATSAFEKEHVTQYLYKNLNAFKFKNIAYQGGNISGLRWTLDTLDDYNMIKTIYEALYNEKELILLPHILTLLSKRPEIADINKSVKRSLMYQK